MLLCERKNTFQDTFLKIWTITLLWEFDAFPQEIALNQDTSAIMIISGHYPNCQQK